MRTNRLYNQVFIEQALMGYAEFSRKNRLSKKKRLLYERKYQQNDQFFSIPSNIPKIEVFNSWLQTKMIDAYAKAEHLELSVLQDIQNSDPFISDYEIDYNLELYSPQKYANCSTLKENAFFESTSCICYRKIDSSNPKEREEHKNWLLFENHNEYQSDENDNPINQQHHCYLLHDLYHHTYLSWQDIVETEIIWLEVALTIQNCNSNTNPEL